MCFTTVVSGNTRDSTRAESLRYPHDKVVVVRSCDSTQERSQCIRILNSAMFSSWGRVGGAHACMRNGRRAIAHAIAAGWRGSDFSPSWPLAPVVGWFVRFTWIRTMRPDFRMPCGESNDFRTCDPGRKDKWRSIAIAG